VGLRHQNGPSPVRGTKGRYPFLTDPLKHQIYRYIGGIVRGEKSDLLAIGGMPDLVHLLVALNKNMTMPDLVRKIKANSSKFLNETRPNMKFAWQEGYGSFSVSVSMLEVVKNYIDQQEEHHKKGSFEEEYIALLKRHNIDFEMQYLFKN
jgi:REP element-mobilizing transposase RayT